MSRYSVPCRHWTIFFLPLNLTKILTHQFGIGQTTEQHPVIVHDNGSLEANLVPGTYCTSHITYTHCPSPGASSGVVLVQPAAPSHILTCLGVAPLPHYSTMIGLPWRAGSLLHTNKLVSPFFWSAPILLANYPSGLPFPSNVCYHLPTCILLALRSPVPSSVRSDSSQARYWRRALKYLLQSLHNGLLFLMYLYHQISKTKRDSMSSSSVVYIRTKCIVCMRSSSERWEDEWL